MNKYKTLKLRICEPNDPWERQPGVLGSSENLDLGDQVLVPILCPTLSDMFDVYETQSPHV